MNKIFTQGKETLLTDLFLLLGRETWTILRREFKQTDSLLWVVLAKNATNSLGQSYYNQRIGNGEN